VSLDVLSALVALAGLCAYSLFGGADFGAGLWMAFAFGKHRAEQREAMFQAMGPVWETNHVWLILILVMLWTAFPSVFSAVFTDLYLPLTVALLGIVFRGAAFAFRHYGARSGSSLPATATVFSTASIITPFATGVCVGAVSAGRLDVANPGGGIFAAWLHPFPMVCGLIGLAIAAYLTPAYMLMRPLASAVTEDVRRSVIAGSLALGAVTTLAIPVALWDADDFADRLDAPRVLVLIAAAVALGLFSLVTASRGLDRLTPVVAGGTVLAVIGAWAAAMYPFMVLPDVRIEDVAAGHATLEPLLLALPVGALILVPSLAFLFWLFATAEPEQQV
jgi:cytochrome d ubiquinol oxidase subunit II